MAWGCWFFYEKKKGNTQIKHPSTDAKIRTNDPIKTITIFFPFKHPMATIRQIVAVIIVKKSTLNKSVVGSERGFKNITTKAIVNKQPMIVRIFPAFIRRRFFWGKFP